MSQNRSEKDTSKNVEKKLDLLIEQTHNVFSFNVILITSIISFMMGFLATIVAERGGFTKGKNSSIMYVMIIISAIVVFFLAKQINGR